MKRIVILAVFLIVTASYPQLASANHMRQVLGDSTTQQATLPPTTEGPGLILPNNPLFFLDTMKQNVRLFLAFSPERKAEIHADIAGERMAELRFELIKDNKEAAIIALEGVAAHLKGSADELAMAEMQGKEVTQLAQNLNENFKRKRDLLDVLEDTSSGELQARVNVVQKALLESKIRIEDSLPPSQLQNEIEENLSHEIADQVDDARASVAGLERAITVLERSASEAAVRKQTKREEAIRKAIAVKNDQLRRSQEQGMREDLKKLELTREEIEAARATVASAREAEEKYIEARRQASASEGSTE